MATDTQAPSLQSPAAPDRDDVSRTLPNALGPEKSILSSMLKDPEQWIVRAQEEGLTREHFYLPSHGLLYGVEKHGYTQPIEIPWP